MPRRDKLGNKAPCDPLLLGSPSLTIGNVTCGDNDKREGKLRSEQASSGAACHLKQPLFDNQERVRLKTCISFLFIYFYQLRVNSSLVLYWGESNVGTTVPFILALFLPPDMFI